MCLGIPGRVVEINKGIAHVDVGGTKKEASLLLMEDVVIGDYVIVHAGFAIEKVDEEAARETLEVVDRLIKGMPE